jgi:hypothetical protein
LILDGDYTKTERIYSVFALLLVGCMLSATLLVMLGGDPPVFNQSPDEYRTLNIILLVGLSVATAVLVIHASIGRLLRLAEAVKILLVVILTMNALFGLLERFVVGVDDAKLIHNFRNELVDGVSLPLQQSNRFSRFGFKTNRVEPKVVSGFRYLMLGNSYTRGSGSSFSSNYPQVVEATLNSGQVQGDTYVSVFAGGVDGYGLEEEERLFELLKKNNYKFNAIILNIMMGADLTNDVPRTVRLAMAGEPQRFHKNKFLFYAFPLNSYLFRYILYFKVAFEKEAAGAAPSVSAIAPNPTSTCTNGAAYAQFVRDRAVQYYGPGAEKRVFLDYNLRFADEIISQANALGLKVFIVLQPDRNFELDSHRLMVPPGPMRWGWTQDAVRQHFLGRVPVLDLGPYFRNRDDLFKCNESHWNDEGNVTAGKIVGAWLAKETQTTSSN